MNMRWSALGRACLAIAVLAGVAPARATPADSTAAHPWLPGLSIRIGGSLAVPSGDLASEERIGFAGGQGLGWHLSAGPRILLAPTLAVRPELSYYRFGEFEEVDVPVLVGTELVSGDLLRRTQMGGVRVYIEYLPLPESGFAVCLHGGVGLMYMRYDDEFRLPDETLEHGEGVIGGTAAGGVGIMLHHLEITLAATLQEPGFENFAPTWPTFDLGAAYWFENPF